MIVLGIDPGTITLGYCVYDSITKKIIVSGAINTKKWRNKNIINFLQKIRTFVLYMVREYQVEKCCVERTFVLRNALHTSLLVVTTDVIKESAGELVPSTTIEVTKWRKLLLNDGSSNKEKCIEYIKKNYKSTETVDETEAIGIAIAASYEATNTTSPVKNIRRKSLVQRRKSTSSRLLKKPKNKRRNNKKV